MSMDQLEEQGLLLPEGKRGEMELSASVNRPALTVTLALGVAACAMIALGGGHAWTWIGCGLFALFLILFLLVSNAGIDRQANRCEELLGGRVE